MCDYKCNNRYEGGKQQLYNIGCVDEVMKVGRIGVGEK